MKNATTSAAILGHTLAALRTAKGLKQSDMAKAVEVGPSSWSRIEKGEIAISVDQLKLAAKILGYTVTEILDIEEAAEEEAARNGVEVNNSLWKILGISALGAIPAIGAGRAIGVAAGGFLPVVGPLLGGVIGGVIADQIAKRSKP